MKQCVFEFNILVCGALKFMKHCFQEELAEGLHLIDFEQLKIENQTYNEKIEERNEVSCFKILKYQRGARYLHGILTF